jgi:hypothetical protein
MAGPPPLAPPPSNSSALEFKSNASGPTPGHALLEHSIGEHRDDHKVVESGGNGDDWRLRSKKEILPSPIKEGPTSAGSSYLKRKRDPLVGMLSWVRLAAKSLDKPGVAGNSCRNISTTLLLRRRCFQTLISAVAHPRLR